jgi:rubrerythrin
MAVVEHFKANESHGFEGVEERIQHVWICAQCAWVGERAYPPSLCD